MVVTLRSAAKVPVGLVVLVVLVVLEGCMNLSMGFWFMFMFYLFVYFCWLLALLRDPLTLSSRSLRIYPNSWVCFFYGFY